MYKFKNKLVYEGDYKNDKKEGYGVLINYDETVAY